MQGLPGTLSSEAVSAYNLLTGLVLSLVWFHWFAPGETSLVHQATDEYWFDAASGYMQERPRRQPTTRGSPWCRLL